MLFILVCKRGVNLTASLWYINCVHEIEAAQKQILPEKGVSWDFDAEEAPAQTSELGTEPVRRPRTVTFESPPGRPSVSTALSPPSTGNGLTTGTETKSMEALPEDVPPSQTSTPQTSTPQTSTPQTSTPQTSQATEKPFKKSRFVVEDSSSGMSSPVIPHAPELHAMLPPLVSPGPSTLSAALSRQSFQGLGVSSGDADQAVLPEVKKGRFSVKDTFSGASSPKPSSIKTLPSDLLSPTRSLSSSPIDGPSEVVRIVGLGEQVPPSGKK